MWESLCANIAIDYSGNQGVFTEIDQCQNQVRQCSCRHACSALGGTGLLLCRRWAGCIPLPNGPLQHYTAPRSGVL